jgi:TPR repeat protein
MLSSRPRFLGIAAQSIACIVLLLSRVSAFAVAGSDADLPEIRAAAEHGHVHDQIALGAAYLSGHGVQQDLKLAAYWYEKAAGLGDPAAENEIGYFYEMGIGVSPNPSRAVHWYQLAASTGSLDAKVNLGIAYLWGKGVPQDRKMAQQLIREAADKGNGIGAAYMGEMYNFGEGVAQDQAAAEHWYEKGAKLHNSLSSYRLGVLLSTPLDHPRNIERAAALFRESADAGFIPAKHSLGLLILNHPELGFPSDEALTNLTQAAAAGTWKSQIVLGVLARDGKSVAKDDRTAYFHFRIAAQQGGDPAQALVQKDLQALEKRLSADQRATIDQDVNTWIQKHNVALEVIYKDGDHWSRFPAFALATRSSDEHAVGLVPVNPF